MTRSVLTALTAGLMIGGGLLFVGGITAGVLWVSGKGPVQTATIPVPPPAQATLSPGVTVDPDPTPARPQVFTPPPAPPEPEPAPAAAQAPAHPIRPAPAPVASVAPPAPLKPSDLDAKPPQSILSMLLKPVPPGGGSESDSPPAPIRQAVPSVLSPAPLPAPAVAPTPSIAPVTGQRPQVSAALPPAPVPPPAPAPAPHAVAPPLATLPPGIEAEPAKPESVKPEPAKAAPPAEAAKAKPEPKAPPAKEVVAKPAKPDPKAAAKAEPRTEPKPSSKAAEKTAPKTEAKPVAEPLAVQWKDGTAGPAVGSVAGTPAAPGPAPTATATPPAPQQQASVMDALALPQAPVGSRVEVAADGQRQTVTTRSAAAPKETKEAKAHVAPGTVAIRSGVFAQEENVRSRLAELKAIGLNGSVYSFTNNAGKTMKVVEVGRYPSRKAAAAVIAKLKAHKLEVYVADPP